MMYAIDDHQRKIEIELQSKALTYQLLTREETDDIDIKSNMFEALLHNDDSRVTLVVREKVALTFQL